MYESSIPLNRRVNNISILSHTAAKISMKNGPIIVRNKRDLDSLLRQRAIVLLPRHRRQIKLQIDGLHESDTAYWERKINRIYYYCGCGEGALSLFLGTPLILGYFFLFSNYHGPFFYIFSFFLSIFILAIGGKILGIIFAKIRLRRNIAALNSLIEHTKKAAGSDTDTGTPEKYESLSNE